ncbi:TPA: hypothetical protein ACH1J3_002900 [Citrobacter werkmanii]
MNNIPKRLLIDCLIMAAQYRMRPEGDAILKVLPLLIADENDRDLCEALYYVFQQDEVGFATVASRLSPELNSKLELFIQR